MRIAVPLRDFSGITAYHCHVVEHEDRGMMGVLQVEGQGGAIWHKTPTKEVNDSEEVAK